MFRATYYVTLLLDAPVNGESLEEAVMNAKPKNAKDLVKVKPGVELIDWQVQLSSATDMTVNGEM